MRTYTEITKITCIMLGMFIFTLISFNCAQVDYRFDTYFVYKNKLPEDVEITVFNKYDNVYVQYLLKPNQEITVKIESDGPKTGIGTPFWLQGDKRYTAKKAMVKFMVSGKCLVSLEREGILDVKTYDNYSESMYSHKDNILIYNINCEKLKLATDCP